MSGALAMQTARFGLGGLALNLPLFWLLPSSMFCASRRAVVMGASLFWFAFTAVLVSLARAYSYRFFHPAWMQWGAALVAAAIYSAYAFGCHWLSYRLPEKVPMLVGMPLGPTMLFAFFEYQVYWAVALWLAWILIKLSDLRRKSSP